MFLQYNSNFDRVVWSPERGLKFLDGASIPPAGVLAHELFHNKQLIDARNENPQDPLSAVTTRLAILRYDDDGNGIPDIEDGAVKFERGVLERAAKEDPTIKPRTSYDTKLGYEFVAPRITSNDGEQILEEPGGGVGSASPGA
jgi:hypothetical protein